MADYYPLIFRAVSQLASNTAEARQALYERARTVFNAKVQGPDSSLSETEIKRARAVLETAIRRVETEQSQIDTAPPAGEDIELPRPDKLANVDLEVARKAGPTPAQPEEISTRKKEAANGQIVWRNITWHRLRCGNHPRRRILHSWSCLGLRARHRISNTDGRDSDHAMSFHPSALGNVPYNPDCIGRRLCRCLLSIWDYDVDFRLPHHPPFLGWTWRCYWTVVRNYRHCPAWYNSFRFSF